MLVHDYEAYNVPRGAFYQTSALSPEFHPDIDWALSVQSPMQFSQFISFFSRKWLIILNTSNGIALPSTGLQNRNILYIIFQHILNIGN
jgi:hypothetical protein